MRNKIAALCWIIAALMNVAYIAILVNSFIEDRKPREKLEICTVDEWEAAHPQQPAETDYLEDPNESEKIAAAVIATIGTDREVECFGYNATYVLKMLTAECGDDGFGSTGK